MHSGAGDSLRSRVSPFGDLRIIAWLPASRSLSQVPTSFIASQRLDIHHMLLLAWSSTCASTISRGPVGSKTCTSVEPSLHICLGLISSSVSPSSRPGVGRESDLTDTEPTCQRARPRLQTQQRPPHARKPAVKAIENHTRPDRGVNTDEA